MTPRILVLLGTLLATPLACADDLPFMQLAVHGGYRAGGGLEDSVSGDSNDLDDGASLALALEFRYGKGDDRFLQLWYARQESGVDDGASQRNVNVEYLHFGGTVPIGDHEKAQGYFAMGIGATRFSASGADAEPRTRFSGSLGLGISMPISAHAAFRLEGRGYVTLVDSSTSIFCRSDNGSGFCRIVASGSTIVQAELLAGISVSF